MDKLQEEMYLEITKELDKNPTKRLNEIYRDKNDKLGINKTDKTE